MSLSRLYGLDEATRTDRQVRPSEIEGHHPDAMAAFDRDVAGSGTDVSRSSFYENPQGEFVANVRGGGWWRLSQRKAPDTQELESFWQKIEKPSTERGGYGRQPADTRYMGRGSHQDIRTTRDEENLGYETVRRAYGEEPFRKLRELGVEPRDCSYDKVDYTLVARNWVAVDNEYEESYVWSDKHRRWSAGDEDNWPIGPGG